MSKFQRACKRDYLRLPRGTAIALLCNVGRGIHNLPIETRPSLASLGFPLRNEGRALPFWRNGEPSAAERGQFDRDPLSGDHGALRSACVEAHGFEIDHVVA